MRQQRFREVCDLCQSVLSIESESLQRRANVALRLQVFDKAVLAGVCAPSACLALC